MPDHHRVLFPPLSARLVANCLASGAIKPFHLLVVRALIWLPLLTVEELARILSQPARTTAAHLLHLERESLVDHVVCAEGGWPRHYRYYVTDLGLYVFAARHSRPLAPERLAAAYPINRAALLTRLARPVVHLWLCDLVSRLLADGPTQGYQLVSYQQPWELSFSDRTGQRQVKLDAALLVQSPTGSQHAFFVCVDQHERLWTHKQDRNWLRDLCAVRTSLLFEQEPLPALLLLSTPTRYAYWAERLASAFSDASRAPIVGAMTSRQQLAQGPFTRLWTPLQALEPDGPVGAPQTCSFARLCLTPASPGLVEQLSNTFSFAHLFAQAGKEGSARQTHRFPRFVGVSLQAEVTHFEEQPRALRTHQLSTMLHHSRSERMQLSALMTLALTDQHKHLLAALLRHPWLCLLDLMALLYGEPVADRQVQRLLSALLDNQLILLENWEGSDWRERERYHLSETGLRLLAQWHSLSPAHYLKPPSSVIKRQTLSPLAADFSWRQAGSGLLSRQCAHTSGLYRSIRHILFAGKRSGAYQIVDWKNEYEAARSSLDPLDGTSLYPRPDAELFYLAPGMDWPASVLVEYDRNTTSNVQLESKFAIYADYQAQTHRLLPPILVITPNEHAAQAIRRAIQRAQAEEVPCVIVLEEAVVERGLLAALDGEQGEGNRGKAGELPAQAASSHRYDRMP